MEEAVAQALAPAPAQARAPKSAAAFRTISEVATELDLPQHVLRFWETRFPGVRPLKRGGGRRYYRPEDVVLLRRIRDLLYRDGYTIRGVQNLLRHNGDKGEAPVAVPVAAPVAQASPNGGGDEPRRNALSAILTELQEIRDLIDAHSR